MSLAAAGIHTAPLVSGGVTPRVSLVLVSPVPWSHTTAGLPESWRMCLVVLTPAGPRGKSGKPPAWESANLGISFAWAKLASFLCACACVWVLKQPGCVGGGGSVLP